MTGLWNGLVSLNDSQLTADFQRLCGIKVLNNSDRSKSMLNGDIHQEHPVCDGNGNVRTINGSASGHAEEASLKQRAKSNYTNGYIVHKTANGSVQTLQNGATDHSVLHKQNYRPNCDDVGNETEKQQYKIDNKILFYLFSFGAALGNEIFYIVFFSFGVWNFDSYVFRKVTLIWCAVMYLGQAAKDIICWPRPKCPPVVRLEERYELEYGMPSTHAMVGVAIPFGVLCFSYGRFEFDLALGILVAISWSVLVSCSRLYLGMHSVLDVLVGIVSAACLMLLFVPLVEVLDTLLVAHPLTIPLLNFVCLVLCLIYPRLEQWSTARGDTSQVLAVFSGIYQGTWFLAKTCTPKMAIQAQMSAPAGWSAVWAGVARQVLGTAVMVVVFGIVKKGALHTMAKVLRLDPKDPKTKQHLGVEFPYKYLSCLVLAFLTSCGMPMCFQMLGLQRGNFLFEVFDHAHYFGL